MLDDLVGPALTEMDPTHLTGCNNYPTSGMISAPSVHVPIGVPMAVPAPPPDDFAIGAAYESPEPKLIGTEMDFISATSVNSFLGYRALKYEYKDGHWSTSYTVTLGDCDERINWHGGGNTDGLAKLSKAIDMLERLRSLMLANMDKPK